jgi:hypothetical protein
MLVTALLLAVATPALAQDGPTWGARPAPGDGQRTSGAFNISVAAGSALSDGVEIFNLTDATATFDVYVADARPTAGGGLVAAARDAQITGPTTWITVGRPTVEVPPRDSAVVPFTIEVPGGTPLGDNTAALLVEPQRSTGAGAIAIKTRVALWVKVKVTALTSDVLGAESEVPGDAGTPWGIPWILVVSLLGLVFLAWLTYVTRHRRHRWLLQRREEQALLRDFRSRRHHDETSSDHR